jgi:hypothetical protein
MSEETSDIGSAQTQPEAGNGGVMLMFDLGMGLVEVVSALVDSDS